MEDVQELKPTAFCAVPRVYDRIYTVTYRQLSLKTICNFMLLISVALINILELVLEGIVNKIASGSLLRNKLFQYAYK